MNREPDWSLWRSFSAVVKHGSLSAAARELGLSQPTLGRHIEALEQALDLSLFDRTLSGLKANTAALRLYEPVATAQNALAQAAILAEGAQAEFSGTVRLTASTVVSNYVLPGLLRLLRERYPAIAIETVPSDSAKTCCCAKPTSPFACSGRPSWSWSPKSSAKSPSSPALIRATSPGAACRPVPPTWPVTT